MNNPGCAVGPRPRRGEERPARAGAAAVLVAAGILTAGLAVAQTPSQSADAWISRMLGALRTESAMSARVRIRARDAGGQEWNVRAEWVRSPGPGPRRNLLEVRETPEGRPEVSEWLSGPEGSLTGWTWLPERRRFLEMLGIQGTDAFPGTVFRYEDLAFVAPEGRRTGRVSERTKKGRRLILAESEPYQLYNRVQTFIDPETALPVHVIFYDVADFPFREQWYEEVRAIEGRPFPTLIRARDILTGARATLTFEDVHFDLSVPDSLFDLERLETRLRRGMDPLSLPAPKDESDP